jgi:Subtilase family
MKNSFYFFNQRHLFVLIILIAFITSCTKKSPVQNKVYLPEYKPGQLVVWRKQGISNVGWELKKANFRLVYGGTLIEKKCENCDDSLELWSGTAVENFINTEVASPRTSPRGKPSGEDDTFYYGLNMIIGLPVESPMPQFTPSPVLPFISSLPKITVAVFDTGIDEEITKNFSVDILSCKTGGNKGWNFVGNNNIIIDEFPQKHGTVVSKFIVDQVKSHMGGNMINILPVKIFDAGGSSDLFNVLCGFSYAQKAGAKIINASFGFYYYNNDSCLILKKYVEKVLTKNNILLVASAGNVIADEDIKASRYLGVPEAELRNLDFHYFYPGGLAKYLPNVFCVTTAAMTLAPVTSPNQNYSKYIVDIGTVANLPGTYSFIHPFIGAPNKVTGSSFATPVFTGKLASWYSEIIAGMGNKEAILTALKIKGVVFDDPGPLANRVKAGRYVQ